MDQKSILIIGANGQLGTALREQYPSAAAVDASELDITDRDALNDYDWSKVKVILNAAAYTNVDGAETPEGKIAAQKINADAVGYLAKIASDYNLTIVHISTDYVFDGTQAPYKEDAEFSPLNVYGRTKAEGDKHIMKTSKHYLIRTEWVIGNGKNFVRTMLELGKKGIEPKVVSDQIGRLTFTTELARAIDYLLTSQAPFGTYNLSNAGEPVSWADITRAVYEEAGYNNLKVTNITTAEYFKDKPQAAKRMLDSTFDLSKIEAVGFKPHDWRDDLKNYIKKEVSK